MRSPPPLLVSALASSFRGRWPGLVAVAIALVSTGCARRADAALAIADAVAVDGTDAQGLCLGDALPPDYVPPAPTCESLVQDLVARSPCRSAWTTG